MSDSSQRLGRAVRTRLAELGVSARALSDAEYITRGQLQPLYTGKSIPRNLDGLDRGLGWLPNSAWQVAGGEGAIEVFNIPEALQPDQVPIYWPRPDKNWRAACEDAWQRWDEHRQEALDHTVERLREELNKTDALWHRRIDNHMRDWPVWLAKRAKRVLEDRTVTRQDPLDVADQVFGTAHYKSFIRLLYQLREEARNDTAHDLTHTTERPD